MINKGLIEEKVVEIQTLIVDGNHTTVVESTIILFEQLIELSSDKGGLVAINSYMSDILNLLEKQDYMAVFDILVEVKESI